MIFNNLTEFEEYLKRVEPFSILNLEKSIYIAPIITHDEFLNYVDISLYKLKSRLLIKLENIYALLDELNLKIYLNNEEINEYKEIFILEIDNSKLKFDITVDRLNYVLDLFSLLKLKSYIYKDFNSPDIVLKTTK